MMIIRWAVLDQTAGRETYACSSEVTDTSIAPPSFVSHRGILTQAIVLSLRKCDTAERMMIMFRERRRRVPFEPRRGEA